MRRPLDRTTHLLVHWSSCTSKAAEDVELLEDAVGVLLRGILTRQTKGVEGVPNLYFWQRFAAGVVGGACAKSAHVFRVAPTLVTLFSRKQVLTETQVTSCK